MGEGDLSLDHFRNNVKIETEKLTGFCSSWRSVLTNDESLKEKEDIQGDINVAIGQAELLMKERFGQFSGLIEQSEKKTGEQEITCQDLDGFWFMVYPQVEDVYRKFSRLEKMKNNKWVEPEMKAVPTKPTVLKKKPVAALTAKPKPTVSGKSGPASSSIRAHILAAKMKMKAAMQEKAAEQQEKTSSQDSAIVSTKDNNEKILSTTTDKENKIPAPENTTAKKTTKNVVITTPSSLKNTKTSANKISPTTKSKIPVRKTSPANKENSTPLITKGSSNKVTVKSTPKQLLTPPTSRKSSSPECNTFDAGFFKVQTPAKKLAVKKIIPPVSAQVEKKETSTTVTGPKKMQKVLSSSVLKERVRNAPIEHKDYSSCMRITRSMKKTIEVRTLNF